MRGTILYTILFITLSYSQDSKSGPYIDDILHSIGYKPPERQQQSFQATSIELIVRLLGSSSSSGSRAEINTDRKRIALLTTRTVNERLRRMPSLAFGPDMLLIVALDESNILRYYSVIHDPRLLRFEEPGPDTTLRGHHARLTDVMFAVSISADPTVTSVALYEYDPNGTGASLVDRIKLGSTK